MDLKNKANAKSEQELRQHFDLLEVEIKNKDQIISDKNKLLTRIMLKVSQLVNFVDDKV